MSHVSDHSNQMITKCYNWFLGNPRCDPSSYTYQYKNQKDIKNCCNEEDKCSEGQGCCQTNSDCSKGLVCSICLNDNLPSGSKCCQKLGKNKM